MATEGKNKRFVSIEIDDEVKKLTIEGVDKDAQVVMRQELSENDLDLVTGGEDYNDLLDFYDNNTPCAYDCPNHAFLIPR